MKHIGLKRSKRERMAKPYKSGERKKWAEPFVTDSFNSNPKTLGFDPPAGQAEKPFLCA